MRLVVTHTVTDGYTYSSDIVLPINYESAEAFYCHFEAKIQAHINSLNKYNQEWEIWKDKVRALSRKGKDVEVAQYYKLRPSTPENEFVFAGKEFDYSNFIYVKDDVSTIDMPTVQTVDEWFHDAEK